MGQVPQQSAERKFVVVDVFGDEYNVLATSVSVDEQGYLAFYRREEATTGYLPVAGFPSGQWRSWQVDDD